MVIAITGANGFVGRNIADYLEKKHQKVKRITRKEIGDLLALSSSQKPENIQWDWLEGVHTVIHTAAIAHSGHKLSAMGEERIRRANITAPLAIADQAAAHGVKRFVFISSAHVYGRSADGLLDEDADMLPRNIYGISKAEAEYALVNLAEKNGLELIILRPPLIYGPGVKANFLALLKLASKDPPMPFSGFRAARSYCYIGNLADGIFQMLRNDKCWNDVYNIADKAPLTIVDLCRGLGNALGKHPFIFYLPVWLMKALLIAAGKKEMIEALSRPLILDTRAIEQTLGWQPPFSTKEGLQATADWYRKSSK